LEVRLGKNKKRPLLPILLVASGILILIVAVIILSSGGEPSTQGDLPNPEIPYPNITRVDLSTAKNAFDSNEAVFVDVRDADSFAAGHIPGARSIPLSELPSRLEELQTEDWIILYCT
jgi:3-mercaptopyruvate sulfurtransferase SseA